MGREFWGSLEVDRCCRCLSRPARWLGGHVTHGPHIVTAGWCEACNEELHGSGATNLYAIARTALGDNFRPSIRVVLESSIMGWCGHWVPAMGLRIRGAPSREALRAAKREHRIAELRPEPREALAMHFGERPMPSNGNPR